MFENTAVMHLLFTATCSRKNSLVNQTNRFFNGFLSDSVEITSCAYTKTIIQLILLNIQLILLNNRLDFVSGIIQQY